MSEVNGNNPNEFERNERRISKLSRMFSDPSHSSSVEGRLDLADAAYELAHDAGLMRDEDGNPEPFVYPSVKREQLYRDTLQRTPRPPVILSQFMSNSRWADSSSEDDRKHFFSLYDPVIALDGVESPVAILETVNDNDLIQGGSKITWLACDSYESAAKYCQAVGWWHEQPGPGEEDGIYTQRDVYDNPYFLKEQNSHLRDIDHLKYLAAVDKLLQDMGLEHNEAIEEQALINSFVFSIDSWNRGLSNEMMGDSRKYPRYLNRRLRDERFGWAKDAIGRHISDTLDLIVEPMSLNQLDEFDVTKIQAINSASSTITEALQTRHELVAVTEQIIDTFLRGFINIALMKKQSIRIFKIYGRESEGQKWLQVVNELVGYKAKEAGVNYVQILYQFSQESRV